MLERSSYPRDLIGYGDKPPSVKWPNNARVAVQFVLNYEEGGENCILHGDPASEAFLSEIVGAQPWPGKRHVNMESIYEYGARAGFWRLRRLFTDRNILVTVFGVATALARNPPVVKACLDADWEIASHGYKWIEYKEFSLGEELEHFRLACQLHEKTVGQRPLGWYLGRCSEHSTDIVSQDGNFLYSSDSYADDLPYWIEGHRGPHLVVPYTLDANDMRFATAQGFNSGDQFYTYLKDTFDHLYEEGADTPKMMSVGLHCRLVGRPGRAQALKRFLDYANAHERVWFARRIDIARHWIRHHPPTTGLLPSRLSHALFLERFGDVYEHTPEIAEEVFIAGLGVEHDTAMGLHAAMSGVMWRLPDQRKLALLNAHPDLAGRLALNDQLTPDSKSEQTSAGLDRLTETQLSEITELNDAYRLRFGFPFIIAVRGLDRTAVLNAFRRRLTNRPEREFDEALRQVDLIAMLRLTERLDGQAHR